jgi:hypothetical protein
MSFFGRIFRGRNKAIDYPATLAPEIEKAMNGLRALTAAHESLWQIGQASWSVDQDTGKIIFVSPKGMRVEAPAQIVGTYNTQDNTWLWGWDNPSVHPALANDARKALEYGRQHGYDILTTRKLACPESQCWELAALTCMLCGSQGVYRGPAGTALVFLTFGKLSMSKAT